MKSLFLILSVLICTISFAQEKEHRWKSISPNDKQKIWYDTGILDSALDDNIYVWVLHMNTPALVLDGVKEPITRTKTLYNINLNTVRYGISKAEYYDAANKKIQAFDYKIETLKDDLRFSYPVTESSFLYTIIKEFINTKKEK